MLRNCILLFKQGEIQRLNWNFCPVSKTHVCSRRVQSHPTDFLSAHEEWPWISVTEHVVG